MSSGYKAKVMFLQKLPYNVSTKRKRHSTIILTPTSNVLPQKKQLKLLINVIQDI